MSVPADELIRRCRGGKPCDEVVARLTAADAAVAAGFDPHHPALVQLRLRAARWAEVHGYGTSPPRGTT